MRYVPGNLVTLVIVCNNHCIDNLFNGESDATRAAIHTRFREILCNLEDVSLLIKIDSHPAPVQGEFEKMATLELDLALLRLSRHPYAP